MPAAPMFPARGLLVLAQALEARQLRCTLIAHARRHLAGRRSSPHAGPELPNAGQQVVRCSGSAASRVIYLRHDAVLRMQQRLWKEGSTARRAPAAAPAWLPLRPRRLRPASIAGARAAEKRQVLSNQKSTRPDGYAVLPRKRISWRGEYRSQRPDSRRPGNAWRHARLAASDKALPLELPSSRAAAHLRHVVLAQAPQHLQGGGVGGGGGESAEAARLRRRGGAPLEPPGP